MAEREHGPEVGRAVAPREPGAGRGAGDPAVAAVELRAGEGLERGVLPIAQAIQVRRAEDLEHRGHVVADGDRTSEPEGELLADRQGVERGLLLEASAEVEGEPEARGPHLRQKLGAETEPFAHLVGLLFVDGVGGRSRAGELQGERERAVGVSDEDAARAEARIADRGAADRGQPRDLVVAFHDERRGQPGEQHEPVHEPDGHAELRGELELDEGGGLAVGVPEIGLVDEGVQRVVEVDLDVHLQVAEALRPVDREAIGDRLRGGIAIELEADAVLRLRTTPRQNQCHERSARHGEPVSHRRGRYARRKATARAGIRTECSTRAEPAEAGAAPAAA